MKRMRAFFTVLFVSLFSVLTIAAQDKHPPNQPNGGNGASGAAPSIAIGSYTHDFGEVKAGTPLRYAFKIKNQGKADLLINSVSPG